MRHKEKQDKRVKGTRWHFLKQYSVQCPHCRRARNGNSLPLSGVSVVSLLYVKR